MNVLEARYWIKRFACRFMLFRVLESILPAIGLAGLIYGIAHHITGNTILINTISIIAFALIVTISVYQHRIWGIDTNTIITYLHQHYSFLQNSLDLVLIEDDQQINALQQLQREKLLSKLSLNIHHIKVPHQLKGLSWLMILCLLSSVVLVKNSSSTGLKENYLYSDDFDVNVKTDQAIVNGIEIAEIIITPPLYTGIKRSTESIKNLSIPEGSQVKLTITYKERVIDPMLILFGKDSIRLNPIGKKSFSILITPKRDLYYQIAWKDDSLTQTDLYTIQLIRDEEPSINITNLEQFTELSWEGSHLIEVDATIKDDYLISDAHIIATVSKGSGESVKFREERIRFNSPTLFSKKESLAKTTLDLDKLGLEPGDELYFYVVAIDNKQSTPNVNRTETYFISLEDTTQYESSIDEGLGVDLMPEYFRSQRQIIIDTEKLLKNKSTISKETFKATSNELGYDQKVLRLRYSEFMGEEFVSGIGPQVSEEDVEHSEEQDVTKEFGHVHDSENEHNLVDSHQEDKHQHKEGESESPLEAFIHAHDEEEEATFYIQSVKAKLRAALTLMWDAELQLRLFEPAKSLPYQYKILNLLKEISNDSRIYVHRTGFDPPPIKEDKRYSADLSEIRNPISNAQFLTNNMFIEIQEVLSMLQRIDSEKLQFTSNEVIMLQNARRHLVMLSEDEPLKYLECIRILSLLIKSDLKKDETKAIILKAQKELWLVLPDNMTKAHKQETTLLAMDKLLLQALDQIQDND